MPSYVVTGASRGIGYGWIKHLASKPENTVVAIVRGQAATEARLSKDNVQNVHVFSADITDREALQLAAAETSKVTGGGLDFLIHNAAVVSDRSKFISVIEDTPQGLEEDLLSSFRANVLGTANVIDAFLPLIRKGKDKKVVVTSTGLADLDIVNQLHIPNATPYTVTKAAANALVAKYNAALGRSEGILFFSMSPGFVNSWEGKPLTEEDVKGFEALGAAFTRYAPHFKGPITVQESVDYQLQVIERATVEEFGGAFVSHFGDKQWL